MDAGVTFLSDLTVKPGQGAASTALIHDLVAAAHAEPGTLGYTWYANADGTRCHVQEHYADAAAAVTHLQAFNATFVGRFLAVFQPGQFLVLGETSPALQQLLAAAGPTYLERTAGFEP
jgi:quinol monooxygenase YgiN